MRRILIADDDRSMRVVLGQMLERAGYQVRATGQVATLWRWIEDGDGDLVITDVVMPDENGLDLIPRIRKARPNLRTIVISAQSTLMTAVIAAERGAFDYLPKPFDMQNILAVVQRAFEPPAARPFAPEPVADAAMIGRSAAMQDVYRTIARLAGTDLTVMIMGETGTGKELVARALHDHGRRRNGPFVTVNMASVPQAQIEAELFGQDRGMMVLAQQRQPCGGFEQARGGTLFLDEIGDMPEAAQSRLLGVLQHGEFTAIGGRQPVKTDVRIIAATRRDLQLLIRQGHFREDLYHRLNVVPLRVPPLRDRADDILLLLRHFLDRTVNGGPKRLDDEAMALLQKHDWPGNVRELANMMQRLAVLHPTDIIDADIVAIELERAGSADIRSEPKPDTLADAVTRHLTAYLKAHDDHAQISDVHACVVAEIERPMIRVVLETARGNQIRAAAMLGMNRNTLRKKIKDLGIAVTRGMNAELVGSNDDLPP